MDVVDTPLKKSRFLFWELSNAILGDMPFGHNGESAGGLKVFVGTGMIVKSFLFR
jgi:hypothetical protein